MNTGKTMSYTSTSSGGGKRTSLFLSLLTMHAADK